MANGNGNGNGNGKRYHVWKLNQRRHGMFIVCRKTVKNDPGYMDQAVWHTRTAAHLWATKYIGQGNFRVFGCEGTGTCGGPCKAA